MTTQVSSTAGDPLDAESAEILAQLERTIPPMDTREGKNLLREVKQVLDDMGVAFFLRQGTCLGAVRDRALIPWDDDLDIGSVIGLHEFTEDQIEPTVDALRRIGCYVEIRYDALYMTVKIMKYRIKLDWQCYRVVKGTIAHYPGVSFPVSLFAKLEGIEFLGDTFYVPSPPQEYLRYKYGPDWVTPKQAGYEKDVLDNMPEGPVPGRPGRLRQLLSTHVFPRSPAKLVVLDEHGDPVAGAEVRVAGLNRSRTTGRGVAKFYLPGPADYAVAVTVNGREEVLYEETNGPGGHVCVPPGPRQARWQVLRADPDEQRKPNRIPGTGQALAARG